MWSLSDEALVAGLAAGDADAATAFVRRFQARVFGLALTMVGDPAVAEEIAQEAFTRAWRHAGAYDARRGRVATWLLSLWTVSQPPDTDQRETAQLREALAELPEDQRRALLLAALFGFTAREIGQIERIPLGTAKTRIRTATQKLTSTQEEGRR
jgi:RNA polymerase sigma-70 factor (ECF subfamily)